MSEGLKALLEAAQFIEQQEKLKLSPQAATAIPSILNEQHQRFIVQTAYDASLTASPTLTTTSSSTTTNGHVNSSNNNNINGISIRNSNIRHGSGNNANGLTLHQVSSSAPAAAATFQHVNGHHQNNSTSLHHHTPTTVLTNGGTITNGHQHNSIQQQPLNINHHNSQLLNANHHDYEFNGNNNSANTSNSGGVTIITANATASPNSSSPSSCLNGRSSEGGRMITGKFFCIMTASFTLSFSLCIYICHFSIVIKLLCHSFLFFTCCL